MRFSFHVCPVPFTATQAVVLDRPVSLQQSELKAKDNKAYDDEGYLQPEITCNQYEQMDNQPGEKDKEGYCNEQVVLAVAFVFFGNTTKLEMLTTLASKTFSGDSQ